MLKRLQIKFMAIIMTMMALVLLVIFATINLTMYRSTNQQTLGMLQRIVQSDGAMKALDKGNGPPEKEGERPVPQVNFSVKLADDGSITEIISDRHQSYTQQEVADYVAAALADTKAYGTVGQLKFLVADKPYGRILVFLDNSIQASSTSRLLWISLSVGLASMVVIFFLSLYLSNWAIGPVKKSYEAQKRFVADASHELKTPLTIISANADVLTTDIGDNKWLSYIKAEAVRMGGLVNNLLYLAKSDSAEEPFQPTALNLSNLVLDAALPFESSCYESGKTLILRVPQGITCMGDGGKLLQVVVIFLDNALKNTQEGAEITLSLSQQGSKRLISVANTGEGLTCEDVDKIFDRFYRGDCSRARQTGGYGLGLSIAKTIVDTHKGKITVDNNPGVGVCFTVTLP